MSIMGLGKMLAMAIAAGGLALSTSAQAVTIVTNGSFETPELQSPPAGVGYSLEVPTGWTGSNVDVVRGFQGSVAADGAQYVDLLGETQSEGTVGGTLSQALSLIAGQTYRLTFSYSNNAFAGPNERSASVSVGDLIDTITHSTANSSILNWTTYSRDFKAVGNSNTLTFTQANAPSNAGVLIDGVSISAVPEPAAWMMMTLGFGFIGFALRRRGAAQASPSFA